MPHVIYKPRKFAPSTRLIIDRINAIVKEYSDAGYSLTGRQLYYRFIAKDWFPDTWINKTYNAKNGLSPNTKNTEYNYKKLLGILADARLAGYVDWHSVEDRTRNREAGLHFENPAERLKTAVSNYALDKWVGQKYRPEVWVEKDALEDVVAVACRKLDVPYFSCRGYTSLTALWDNAMVLRDFAREGITPVILHLGDFDPSGLDMSRNIEEQVQMFMNGGWEMHDGEAVRSDEGLGESLIFVRLGLNMDQIEQYNPPPNPAKKTDSRFKKFQAEHGDESWELDAMDPEVIAGLIDAGVREYLDVKAWNARWKAEQTDRKLLSKCATCWNDVADFLKTGGQA